MATTVSEQIVREAPEIEAQKLALIESAKALEAPELPAYQVAGLTPEQLQAIELGQEGIGVYQPYMDAAAANVGAGAHAIEQGIATLQGADTRGQFSAAQQAYNQAMAPAQDMSRFQSDIDLATNMAVAGSSADLSQGRDLQMQGVDLARSAAQQEGFGTGAGTIGTGIASLTGAAQGYDPSMVEAYMNPYQNEVIQKAIDEINRQGDIRRQELAGEAVRRGAFGGSRAAIQQAEFERNLMDKRNQTIAEMMMGGYDTAQTAAMDAFEQQQQRQLAQGQALESAGTSQANIAAQQATAEQNAAQMAADVGQNVAAQQISQAELMQSAGRNVADTAATGANIAATQSQTMQDVGSGIADLAKGQYDIGASMAAGIGELGGALSDAGIQGAALGETAQQLAQTDVANLYGLGEVQQLQQQAELDALRNTQLQEAYQPYEQIAFQSDILTGAPSTQQTITQKATPDPSIAQQAIGTGAAIIGGTKAAESAGVL